MTERNYIIAARESLLALSADVRDNYKPEKLFAAVLDGMNVAHDENEQLDAWAMRMAVARVLGNKNAIPAGAFSDDESRDEYMGCITSLWVHITRMHDAITAGENVDESGTMANAHRWNAHNEWKELVKRCLTSYKCDFNDVFRFEGRIYGVGAQKGRACKAYTVMSDGAFRKYVEALIGCMMDGEKVDYGKKRESASKRSERIEKRKEARKNTNTANAANETNTANE